MESFKELLMGCGAIVLAFVLFFVAILCLACFSESKEFTVPGRSEITLDNSGKYEVYYHFHSLELEKKPSRTPLDFPEKLQIKFFDQAGKPVPWNRIKDLKFEKNSGNIMVGDFSIDKAGKLTIESSGVEEKRSFSISKPVGWTISIIVWTFAGIVFVAAFIPIFRSFRK